MAYRNYGNRNGNGNSQREEYPVVETIGKCKVVDAGKYGKLLQFPSGNMMGLTKISDVLDNEADAKAYRAKYQKKTEAPAPVAESEAIKALRAQVAALTAQATALALSQKQGAVASGQPGQGSLVGA